MSGHRRQSKTQPTITVFAGPNGSGKSTFLKVASGLLKPSAGTMEVYGSIQPLIEIGAGFNPEFSGMENIYLNGTMLGFTKKEIKEKYFTAIGKM